MVKQVFVNELKANFNLRCPKSDKPTNIYLVCRINNKQVKLSTGVKVYPDHWNKKKEEAYIGIRLTELDNINNSIVNNKLTELKICFIKFKQYLCTHPNELAKSILLLKQHIYKDKMKQEIQTPATAILKQLIAGKSGKDSTKNQYRANIDKFERFLKENEISNTWENMNLNTIQKYAKQITTENDSPSTLRNILKGTIFNLLKIADKRENIPFSWTASNLNSFEFPKDKSNKELASNKQITLTEEQLDQLYHHTATGTETQIKKYTEIKDLFVLQCLVGQRIGDMQKFFNGDNERDEEAGTISIIQQKTNTKAIIPLLPLAREIISKYENKELRYYKERNSIVNEALKEVGKQAGLDTPVTYEVNGNRLTEPFYKLIHTHTARHTFITILCRKGIPKDTVIIATGHEDTKMIDEVYSHLNSKDKANKVSNAFKSKLSGGIFDMREQIKDTNLIDNKETIAKPKKTMNVLDYIFAETTLLYLHDLHNQGIDIFNLTETVRAINIIKNMSSISKVKPYLSTIDKTLLYERIDKINTIVWLIARHSIDFTLIQIFQQKVTELGLSDTIKETIKTDDLDYFWSMEEYEDK